MVKSFYGFVIDTFVYLGGMSKKPAECPTSSLIFKNITMRGFWMSNWYAEGGSGNADARQEMYAHLAEWFKNGQLKSTVTEEHKIDNFKTAIDQASKTSNAKQLLVFS